MEASFEVKTSQNECNPVKCPLKSLSVRDLIQSHPRFYKIATTTKKSNKGSAKTSVEEVWVPEKEKKPSSDKQRRQFLPVTFPLQRLITLRYFFLLFFWYRDAIMWIIYCALLLQAR